MHKHSIFLSKTIVITIVLLFIGASIVPIISGYDKNSSIQLNKEYPTNLPLNDDYINAYWKFDECSGDTVGDSSGHNYDGTRYGATWTTSGYSGCALEFDGVDDYVDLTDHVNGIAVNKTDDYIISFYFKSTQTIKGIILSLTGYKNVPEFRIELQPNGSLLFKIWTGLCGMILYSGTDHNDGQWHEVEIFFNGLSTDPKMQIYIDGYLEGTLVDWLCPIEYTDYIAASIGRRASDDTGCYEGVIDELKFIKYEQGNEQNPPTISGPTSGEPEIEYDFTFTTSDPEEDDILKLEIDWDDGTIDEIFGPFYPGEVVTASHTWIAEDRFDIIARSVDSWDESPWSDPYVVRIGNQPPDNTIITGQRYGDPQEQLTYTFVSHDYEGEDIKYFIDWGDGTTTETDYYASGTEITEDHSWDANDDYSMKAKAIDIKNKEGDWTYYPIRIGDQPPSDPKIYGAVQGLPGNTYDYAFISVDPEVDNLTYEIDWGDGNIETNIGPILSGEILTRSHSWNNTRNYIIKSRAKDEYDYYTDWSEFEVIIPRNKGVTFNALELLFARFPITASLIRYLFKLEIQGR
ncbi:MAG: hypothetical protein JSU91_01225 [Thermoplasmatales archaeon]|nr:MAG: hypothetical protein JSU91_01225 [Thermoplasmatales archaeon]